MKKEQEKKIKAWVVMRGNEIKFVGSKEEDAQRFKKELFLDIGYYIVPVEIKILK